jgi:DNA-binding MarR family transcriptional regulator
VSAAPTPWLDEREHRAWRAFIAMDAHLFRHLERQLQADSDLSGSDYAVLVELSEAPDEQLRLFELGQALQWEKSRLSHQLTRMGRRGLVERRACSTDARGAHVALTPAGRSTIEAAAPPHVEELRRVFIDALDAAQLDQLTAIADRVLHALGAREEPTAGATTARAGTGTVAPAPTQTTSGTTPADGRKPQHVR